jgi:dienelactone hydrolase
MRARSFALFVVVGCGGGASTAAEPPPAIAGADAFAPASDGSSPADAASVLDSALPPPDSSSHADAAALPDPSADGPFAIAETDATATVASTGDSVPVHVAYPTAGPSSAPYAVVVIAHGFQLPASQYYGYAKRLATHGFVALTADYPAALTDANNVQDTKDLIGALDWVLGAQGALAGKADPSRAGAMGHSRGGKDAVLAASMDARFKAVLGLDPVDAKPPFGNCDAMTECPDARHALASMHVPTAFLGETTDATAGSGGQACAPAAGNFTTFYAAAPSPSLQVTIAGANHMSFLDDPTTCGLTCSLCNASTAAHDRVLDLARAMPVAFFAKTLRGQSGYDAWLSGASAQARWVQPGLAAIAAK